jgi:hypothetical protein
MYKVNVKNTKCIFFSFKGMGMTTILTLTAMFSSVREDILYFFQEISSYLYGILPYSNLFVAAFGLFCCAFRIASVKLA